MMENYPKFLQEFRVNQSFPSVTERYFKPKAFLECEYPQCVLVHSNKLGIVTISPDHPIIAEKKNVTMVNFETGGNVNRLKNKVSGKFKRGGQKLKAKSPLCVVHCSDDSQYCLFSCAPGTLVEVNERLIEEPQLLTSKPWSEGYVAIILPPLRFWEKCHSFSEYSNM